MRRVWLGLALIVALAILWSLRADLGRLSVVPRTPGTGGVATAPRHIEISNGAWQHIIDRHTAGGSMNAGKSVFNAGVDIRALIRGAETASPISEPNGRLERVVDAGRDIGTDRATGRQTRTYTVITTESGELVTAFPGVP